MALMEMPGIGKETHEERKKCLRKAYSKESTHQWPHELESLRTKQVSYFTTDSGKSEAWYLLILDGCGLVPISTRAKNEKIEMLIAK